MRLYVLEFPLYRTYVTAAGCSDNDRAIIERTIAAARRRWQGTDADIFNFVRDALTLDLIGNGLPYSRPRVRNFALKMQQFTGPMAAKSLEDTAFYRYHALLGLNEVGGHPTLPGLSVERFSRAHGAAGRAISAWPDRDRDARHQARRGRAHAHPGAVRIARAVGRACRGMAEAQRGPGPIGERQAEPERRATNTCCIRR